MLRIILGTDLKANRDYILNSISQDVKDRQSGRILIVPELASHDAERRLADRAGDTASRYAEVLSFSRLSRRVSDEFAIGSGDCLDNGGRIVAMAAATKNITSKLKSYAGYLSRPEFLTNLVDAVDEFKRCCISSDDIRNAAAKTEGVFAQKLDELALILDAYDAVTAKGKRDPRDQTTWLLEQIETTDFAKNHIFYIDGFPDFTRQHMALIEHFLLESPIVTISMNSDMPGSSSMAFEKAGKTAMALLQYAKNNHIKAEVLNIKPDASPLHKICLKLYQGNSTPDPALFDVLQAFRTESIYDECLCAAQKILTLVRQGFRYRDISVVCSDMAAYEDSLRMVFSRCGIPTYRSGTEDVLQRSVINSLLSILSACLNGFDQQNLLQYMKSVLSPLDMDEADLLENYAILWGIRNSRWTRPFENHPDGLGGEWDESARNRLAELENSRNRLIDPLVALQEAFKIADSIKSQLLALSEFFLKIQLAERLEHMAQEMDRLGDNRSAQVLNQLWDVIVQALEQMYDMLGDTHWDAEGFSRLLSLLLSQYDIGTIPTVLDSVMVGPVSAMRCHQVRHQIVLGVHEGAMPGYSGVSGILTDREREQLRLLDVPLTGGGMEGLQSEFAEIYGVFNSATDSICVICGSEQPSFIFHRLASIAGGEINYTPELGLLTTDKMDAAAILVSRKDKDLAHALDLDENYRRINQRVSHEIGAVTPEYIKQLYGNKLNLSASQIDKHADCRFSYFLKYGIKAQELKEVSVDPAEFGTYFHAVLEQTVRKVMELGGFHRISLEETIALAMDYSSQYIKQRFSALDSSRVSYLFERNVQELECLIRELWQELNHSLFEPELFEVGFGDGKELPAVEIAGGKMDASLRGFVDRVDKWQNGDQNYFRIVDYKTGKKSFDYCDVFNGMGLQMLLYMFALEQGGECVLGSDPIPVGVQYFSARYPYINETCLVSEEIVAQKRSKELTRKGLVLSNDAVLAAMEPDGAPKRLAVSQGKDGSASGDIASTEQFSMLRKYIFNILRKMVDEIASGTVSPNPYTRGNSHDACRFCPYGAVCHKASVAGRRNYMAMKSQRFWDEIEKEVQSDG